MRAIRVRAAASATLLAALSLGLAAPAALAGEGDAAGAGAGAGAAGGDLAVPGPADTGEATPLGSTGDGVDATAGTGPAHPVVPPPPVEPPASLESPAPVDPLAPADASETVDPAYPVPPAPLGHGGDGGDGGQQHGITSFGFSVTPATVAPGGTVTLTAEGCEAPSVTVTSGIFDTVTLTGGSPGTATVDADAKAGARYEVAFDCKGERGTTTLTLVSGSSESRPPGAHKGVKAGFGDARSTGLGATELVTGTVLIAGALAAAVVLIRRRGADGGA
ncbi:hypothetical protein [Streptomyces sp.]|uniref:hypothetical protein n=1 Tax=Streptomyces sp. TaxID=1931 RepID=UPI002810B19B|nr:hypothetical protein [Streptomyces sp.]